MMQRHTASLSFAVLVGLSGLGYFARISPRRSIGVLLWLTVVLSAAVSAEALIYRACRVVDIGNVLNGYCSYEIAGMVHFSNRPMTDWQGLEDLPGGRKGAVRTGSKGLCLRGVHGISHLPTRASLRSRRLIASPICDSGHACDGVAPSRGIPKAQGLSGGVPLGLAGSEIRYPSHERIEENSFGIEEWSLLPHVKRMVFLLEHRAAPSAHTPASVSPLAAFPGERLRRADDEPGKRERGESQSCEVSLRGWICGTVPTAPGHAFAGLALPDARESLLDLQRSDCARFLAVLRRGSGPSRDGCNRFR